MPMFLFKVYNPGKLKFINLKSNNSAVISSFEAQQVLVVPSSGICDASTSLLAVSNYFRNAYNPFIRNM
jgi:hypothetical protein